MTTQPLGFAFCGDTAPSGACVCNRGSMHEGDHSFRRRGEVIATWPNPTQGQPIHSIDLSGAVVSLALSGAAPSDLALNLRDWWLGQAEDEIKRTVPKAVEYGATDLVDIGRDLARCMGRTVTDEEAAELGIFFYLRGKMSRWVDAVARGDRVSDDTLFDIGVYVRMAQRVRSHGGWPGLKQREDAK